MNVTAGMKTSEWIVTILTIIGSVAAAIQGSLPPRWAAVVSAVATASYSVSRGLAKTEPPVVAVVPPPTPPPVA